MERLHELMSGLLIVDVAQIIFMTGIMIALIVLTAKEKKQ